jgi:transposase
MTKKIIKIQIRRAFSEEFKRARVEDYEKGRFTATEIAKLYHLGVSQVYHWVRKYSHYPQHQIRIVEMADSNNNKIKAYQEKIRQLEQAVGQKQIQIDLLEQIISLAGEKFGVDLKKNGSTPHSGSFGKIQD